MASAVKKCRVCGKEYETCRSANRAAGVFRWQEVACSPECGSVYLQQVNASRGVVDPKRKSKYKKPAVIEADVVEALTVSESVIDAPVEDMAKPQADEASAETE